MYVTIDGARLFFDALGGQLEVNSGVSRERPTMIVLHGGPGHDHTGMRTHFDRYTDLVQVVYLDHRGNGRSRGGTAVDPEGWTLDRWADDVAALADELGIVRPIVYGQSFGGMVAQRYAARHPGHALALIFSSTGATFDLTEVVGAFSELGGSEIGEIAERFWTRMSEDDVAEYFDQCSAYYNYGQGESIPGRGALFQADVLRHFGSSGGEIRKMDLRPGLASVTQPVLVITGDRDPVTSPARSREIAAALPTRAEYVEIGGAGHGAYRDKPVEFESALRGFLERAIAS